MRRPTRDLPRRGLLALLALLTLLASHAHAQIDDRARELIEGIGAQAADLEITTLDQTMVMVIHNLDEPYETRTRVVIDYPGERIATVSEAMGMTTVIRMQDGEVTMTMMGMSFPAPPGMEESLTAAFETDPNASGMLNDDAVATYDGEVDYAGILTGQQVTYTGSFGVPGLGVEASTVRLVFDGSGRLLGQVVATDDIELLVVFVGDPHADGALIFDTEMYEYVDGSATLYATISYEEVRMNEPIDESLFQ